MLEKVDPAIFNTPRAAYGRLARAFRSMDVGDVIEVPHQAVHSQAKAVGIRVSVRKIDGRFYAKRTV